MYVADRRPILFFDSGVGGLSVLAPTRALLPAAPLVYVADSAGFPYGTRSEAEIAARVPALLGRLAERYDPRLIVIACNTASTIALGAVRAALDLPIVGTVPAIKPAAAVSVTRTIGVLGTDATVRQPYVDDLARRFAADCRVLRHGSARLVTLAEAALAREATPDAAYAEVLAGLLAQPGGDGIDVVVNACTHFPLVADRLAAAAPRPLRFIDGGPGIARRVAHLLEGTDWPDAPGTGTAVFTRLAERYDPRLIVIACNTASTIALGAVRAALDLPIVGTVPAIKPAAAVSVTRTIGVLGTDATVRQPYVDDLARRFAADCRVLRHGSARLVTLAEAALAREATPDAAYAEVLAGLLAQPGGDGIDVVVNACTHFPLVADRLAAAAPRPLRFIDGGPGIARRVAHLLEGTDWPDAPGTGTAVFTRLDDRARLLAPALAIHGLARLEAL